MIRKLGFDKVMEVSFGADMVAKEYNKLLGSNGTTALYLVRLPGHCELC
jgi:iron only hydrogenase large subunit-like protein